MTAMRDAVLACAESPQKFAEHAFVLVKEHESDILIEGYTKNTELLSEAVFPAKKRGGKPIFLSPEAAFRRISAIF